MFNNRDYNRLDYESRRFLSRRLKVQPCASVLAKQHRTLTFIRWWIHPEWTESAPRGRGLRCDCTNMNDRINLSPLLAQVRIYLSNNRRGAVMLLYDLGNLNWVPERFLQPLSRQIIILGEADIDCIHSPLPRSVGCARSSNQPIPLG